MAPRRAGDVYDERRRIPGLRRGRRQAAQPHRRTACGDGGRCDGPEARHRDAGPGRADRARARPPAAAAQVRLGNLIRRTAVVVVWCLAMTMVACSSGSAPPNTASPSRTAVVPSASPPISGDWAQYHRGAGRSGVGPAAPAVPPPETAWNTGVDAGAPAPP